ncbi:MAG: efflux RND transporter permease subunit [Acidobacteriota bacterium]
MSHSTPPQDPSPDEHRTTPNRWESLLPSFSLGRPVTVIVLLATVLVVGVVATVGIPLETFPQGFSPPFLSVVAPWPDASPQDVLEKIVQPLEDEISTVRGLSRLSSLSTNGSGLLFLTFKQGTDMDIAYREVRDRVERTRRKLPDDVDRVYVNKQDLSDLPIFMVGLAVDPELSDPYQLITDEILKPLERLDGVASVETQGLEEKEILIEVDRRRAEAAGLDIYRLAQELGNDNFTMASGNVLSGASKLLLRSVARYPDLDTLRQRPVGEAVRLQDVATVLYEEPEQDFTARVNSRPAVAVLLFKEGQENTLAVCERIQGLVDEMQENPRLASMTIVPILNQGDFIRSSLGVMLDSGRIGALFAIGVLFFFLRRLRMTLIITLSIPLSMLIALTVMYFGGETLNILTLLGLMISVGLLVDNSVVVAENIHRLHRAGLPRREAAVRGAGEISLAVVMATLTTIAVFLPISLIEGNAQFFLLRLSVPISVSLAASLAVALVFVPLAAYVTLPADGGDRSSGKGSGETQRSRRANAFRQRVDALLRSAYNLTLGKINQQYNRLLAHCLRRRMDTVLATAAVLALTSAVAFEDMEIVAQQENERPGFEVDVELPGTWVEADAREYFRRVEGILEERQDAWDLQGYFIGFQEDNGEIQGWFNSPRTTDLSPTQIVEEFTELLPEAPGLEVYTGSENRSSDCQQDNLHCVRLYGEDTEQLGELREELQEVFRVVDGVIGVRRGNEPSPDQLSLLLDRDRLQRQLINPQAVAGVVAYALRGQSLPKVYREGREIPVRVRFQEQDRDSLEELASFAIPKQGGPESGVGRVALGSVARPIFSSAPESIYRRNKRTSTTITLEIDEERKDEVVQGVSALSAQLDLPEGVTFDSGVRATLNADALALLMAAGLSVAFIYLLMAFLFESFILPLSIILTIPLASIGVGWIHFLSGYSLDFLGAVASILLIGVVVNNGIVLVDYVNRLRREGATRSEALLVASERRFRPIMMTALTTICATVPLTVGGPTDIGMSYTSFGLSLVGGMTTATLLTLLVVPVFYTLFDDLRERLEEAVSARGKTVDMKESEAQPATS